MSDESCSETTTYHLDYPEPKKEKHDNSMGSIHSDKGALLPVDSQTKPEKHATDSADNRNMLWRVFSFQGTSKKPSPDGEHSMAKATRRRMSFQSLLALGSSQTESVTSNGGSRRYIAADEEDTFSLELETLGKENSNQNVKTMLDEPLASYDSDNSNSMGEGCGSTSSGGNWRGSDASVLSGESQLPSPKKNSSNETKRRSRSRSTARRGVGRKVSGSRLHKESLRSPCREKEHYMGRQPKTRRKSEREVEEEDNVSLNQETLNKETSDERDRAMSHEPLPTVPQASNGSTCGSSFGNLGDSDASILSRESQLLSTKSSSNEAKRRSRSRSAVRRGVGRKVSSSRLFRVSPRSPCRKKEQHRHGSDGRGRQSKTRRKSERAVEEEDDVSLDLETLNTETSDQRDSAMTNGPLASNDRGDDSATSIKWISDGEGCRRSVGNLSDSDVSILSQESQPSSPKSFSNETKHRPRSRSAIRRGVGKKVSGSRLFRDSPKSPRREEEQYQQTSSGSGRQSTTRRKSERKGSSTTDRTRRKESDRRNNCRSEPEPSSTPDTNDKEANSTDHSDRSVVSLKDGKKRRSSGVLRKFNASSGSKGSFSSLNKENDKISQMPSTSPPSSSSSEFPSAIHQLILSDLWLQDPNLIEARIKWFNDALEDLSIQPLSDSVIDCLGVAAPIVGAMRKWAVYNGIQREACRLIYALATRERIAVSFKECGVFRQILLAMKSFALDETIQTSGCAALHALTCPYNKSLSTQLVEEDGLKVIVQAMKNFPTSNRIQQRGVLVFCCVDEYKELHAAVKAHRDTVRVTSS